MGGVLHQVDLVRPGAGAAATISWRDSPDDPHQPHILRADIGIPHAERIAWSRGRRPIFSRAASRRAHGGPVR